MMFEKEMEIDCGLLGKRLALVSFDYNEGEFSFNDSIYIQDFGQLGERLSECIINAIWDEIKCTPEYKEMVSLLTTKEE